MRYVWPCANHEVHETAHKLWVSVLLWVCLIPFLKCLEPVVDSQGGPKLPTLLVFKPIEHFLDIFGLTYVDLFLVPVSGYLHTQVLAHLPKVLHGEVHLQLVPELI